MSSPSKRSLACNGAGLGLGLAVLALLLLGLAPLGWREGWWHFRFSFFWLMTSSAWIALAAALVCVLALALGRAALGRRGVVVGAIGFALGAMLTYVPWQYRHTLNSVPRIHDISTDTENPPRFVAAIPARAAENANPVTYQGPELAAQQKAAYPDLAPLKVAVEPAEAFQKALDAAQAMRGWKIVDSDRAAGRIEANQASLWFGFVDDIVIRVAPDGAGSRIDVRSVSRQGRSDFGVNARRIRAYVETLNKYLGSG